MLDVHVLITNPRADWVAQCKASIAAAIAAAGFPVAVHYLDGEIGHIGRGRARGYALGEHPYATCVDDDDYVLPNAFAQMREALESGTSAVCTPEWEERTGQPGRLFAGISRHHLIAYRRTDIIDHTQWACCGDVAQINRIGVDAVDLPARMYVNRMYRESAARKLRYQFRDELRAAHGLRAA